MNYRTIIREGSWQCATVDLSGMVSEVSTPELLKTPGLSGSEYSIELELAPNLGDLKALPQDSRNVGAWAILIK